jgi:hypothetical protein
MRGKETSKMNAKWISLVMVAVMGMACGGSQKRADSSDDATAGDKAEQAAENAEDSIEQASENAGEAAEDAGDKVKRETKDEE